MHALWCSREVERWLVLQEQLVQNPDSSMRSSCAAALLQFLLDWPLKDHRLTQHLEFILSNLAFEIEDGRLQARPA